MRKATKDVPNTQVDGRPPGSPMRRILVRVMRTVLLVYLLVLMAMLLLENYLIFPAPKYPVGDWQPRDLRYEDVYFESEDGTRLHGWYLAHPHPQAYVLFCHGNGENVGCLAPLLRTYFNDLQLSVLAFDYRGYGRSQGRANEMGVLADGRAAHEWLAQRAGIAPRDVVLIGRSLGGAVAVDTAAARGARALVLERTFTKMPDVAARLYPLLPIRLLMRTQFDSLSKIVRYEGPLLQSHGTADEIVPLEIARKLFDMAPMKQKQFFEEPGLGHNDPYCDEYWGVLGRFLSNLPP